MPSRSWQAGRHAAWLVFACTHKKRQRQTHRQATKDKERQRQTTRQTTSPQSWQAAQPGSVPCRLPSQAWAGNSPPASSQPARPWPRTQPWHLQPASGFAHSIRQTPTQTRSQQAVDSKKARPGFFLRSQLAPGRLALSQPWCDPQGSLQHAQRQLQAAASKAQGW